MANETSVREMSLLELMSQWRVGSGDWSWDDEFHWLRINHGERLDLLATSLQETGQHDPIQLGSDGRVWDGHHRVCAAFLLGIPSVLVELPAEASR